MRARYFFLIFCMTSIIAGCTDNHPSKKQLPEKTAAEPASRTHVAANKLNVVPELFVERFNQRMKALQHDFQLEEPKIKIGPNQNTFQSNPTHQITIIGTVDKKTGYVINAMLVARGNDKQGMENIIAHATGMIVGYKPEITAADATKEISNLIAVYDAHKAEAISKIYKGLKLTYGMQADMGLSHFSVRPEE